MWLKAWDLDGLRDDALFSEHFCVVDQMSSNVPIFHGVSLWKLPQSVGPGGCPSPSRAEGEGGDNPIGQTKSMSNRSQVSVSHRLVPSFQAAESCKAYTLQRNANVGHSSSSFDIMCFSSESQ